MATKICFFNHKGGVSKTTNLYHIAWMLSKKGQKVIMVDADSQCNLSILAMQGEQKFENFIKSNPDATIKSALAPAFHAKAERLQAFNCVKVQDNDHLWLIPGSFDISEYEVQLGVSFQLGNTFSTMQNLPGAFNYMIEQTAERLEADYVLVDMNPSLSAINQALFMSSDFFVIPTAPDYFSCMAVKSLALVLPKWEKWAKSARTVFSDADYRLPNAPPKFLGFTISNFTVRNGEPARGYDGVVSEITDAVEKDLVPSLREAGMLLPNEAYLDGYCLGKISDFNTLMAQVQTSGLPVFELKSNHVGTVEKTQSQSIERFKAIFELLADRIINLVAYETSYQPV